MCPWLKHPSSHRIGTLLGFVTSVVAFGEPPSESPGILPSRVIHRFDFDERPQGNVENLPRYWIPLRSESPDFPKFALARFDFEIGRSAPPSFYLSCSGRNVAYHYSGPETQVVPRSEYRLEGFVRPDKLKHARAFLSAYFVDGAGRTMHETLVRSSAIGGAVSQNEWVHVELDLPAAPSGAVSVGLAAWVLQAPMWKSDELGPRPIHHLDVQGGAWFDDIVLHSVPQIDITTGVPGNVLTPDQPQELQALLADFEDGSLRGHLRIVAADGVVVEDRDVSAVVEAGVEPTRIAVGHLPPGLYSAWLTVSSPHGVVASRTVDFLRLAPTYHATLPRAFGVAIDPRFRVGYAAEAALLTHQRVGCAKIPIWPSPDDLEFVMQGRWTLDRFLQTIAKRGIALSAVLADVPDSHVAHRPPAETLIATPAKPPDPMSEVTATYATLFRSWQLGSDGGKVGDNLEQLAGSLTGLQAEMNRFITVPILAAPVWGAVEPSGGRLPIAHVTVNLGTQTPVEHIEPHLRRWRESGYANVSAFIEPLEEGVYRRLPRLGDFARRIVAARHGGAETVYVPQTWHSAESSYGPRVRPSEEFIIVRTISDMIADQRPGQVVNLGPGITCLCFDQGSESTLVLWDATAPLEGRIHRAQLGQARHQVDLWGQVTALERDEQGFHRLRLSPMPTFAVGVEHWLPTLRNSFTLEPDHVESGVDSVVHRLHAAHAGDQPLTGTVEVIVPDSWKVSPKEFRFAVGAGESATFPLQLHYPLGESAGRKRIIAKVSLQNPPYNLEVPLSVEIGLRELDVRGSARIDGGDLLLRQIITNRSTAPLSLRSSAQVPGHERQYRPLNNLGPNETQSLEYRIPGGARLAGAVVRLSVRPINDNRRVHHLELVVR